MICSLRKSLLFALVVAALIPAALVFGQSRSSNSYADKIIEVIATHTTPDREHSYVFLRVFSDRMAECESSTASDSGYVTTKRRLTDDEYGKIQSAVAVPSFGPKYATRYAIVDSWTKWRIEINGSGQTKVTEVLEFSPSLARIMKHAYPDALVKLGCTVERLRAVVLGETGPAESECAIIIGTRNQPRPEHASD